MTGVESTELWQQTAAVLGERYRLERLIAANVERVLFRGRDELLNRPVSIRVNFYSSDAVRAWFIREAEALARLDHAAIRHVYDVGVSNNVAYRIGNWIEGEGLQEAVARGPRAIPDVHNLARFLLSGVEHAHAWGVIIRRMVPSGLLVSVGGRGTLTDLRFSSYTLPVIPANERPSGLQFMAPEVREGQPGDFTADIYAAGAVLYYAITGVEPNPNPAEIVPPTNHRAACPQALERVLMRALREAPGKRFLTARTSPPKRGSFPPRCCSKPPPRSGAPGRTKRPGSGKNGCAGPWETITRCSISWGPADSAGSTGCATCISNGWLPSRCCTLP